MIALFLFQIIMLFSLSFFAFRKIRSTPNTLQFIYKWGAFLGSFVWEDLFIFSLFFAFSFLIGLIFLDIRLTLLMITVFWTIRAAGESLYFFLQQFHVPSHHPHNLHEHFVTIHALFGPINDQKAYILMQVLQQSICMLALTSLFLLNKYWDVLPKGF